MKTKPRHDTRSDTGDTATMIASNKRPRTLNNVEKTFAPFANSWRSILLLVLAATLLRLLYIALFSPYALIEDEAHYWEWSRNLDWSYYSKGPGVALAIRASTALLGETAFAVRLPAVLASLIVTLAIAALAVETTGDKRAGFFAAACVLLAPIFQMSAILMTIDGPYVAAWALAAWAAWRALTQRSAAAWPALAAALAVGFLFKYTIILLPPGILLFALLNKTSLKLHKKWRLWATAAAAIALLGLLPIVIWNAQNDWATFKHLLGHLAMPGGDVSPDSQGLLRWNPLWTLELIATQAAMLGGVLFLSLYSTLEAIRRQRTATTKTQNNGPDTASSSHSHSPSSPSTPPSHSSQERKATGPWPPSSHSSHSAAGASSMPWTASNTSQNNGKNARPTTDQSGASSQSTHNSRDNSPGRHHSLWAFSQAPHCSDLIWLHQSPIDSQPPPHTSLPESASARARTSASSPSAA